MSALLTPTRIILRIEITPAAKERFNGYCDLRGKKQIAAMSRLVEWFGDQPEVIQSIIQGDFPASIQCDVAHIILKQMAKKKKTPVQTGVVKIAPHHVASKRAIA